MRRITFAILCLALASWPAHAQTTKPVKSLIELNGPCNPLGDTRPQCQQGGPGGVAASAADNVLAALAKPFQDLATFIGEDADGAIALSTAIPALQDGHGQQCCAPLCFRPSPYQATRHSQAGTPRRVTPLRWQ